MKAFRSVRALLVAGLVAVAAWLPLGTAIAAPAAPVAPESPVYDAESYVGETYDKTTIFTGNSIRVSACTINGTAIVMGNDIDFDAEVDGDLIVMGRYVAVRGHITGSVISMAQRVDLYAAVDQEVYGACETFLADDNAKLGRDVFVAGNTVTMQAPIGRDLYAGAGTIYLNDAVGGDATLAGDIRLAQTASVGGAIAYYAEKSKDLGANPTIAAKAKWIQTYPSAHYERSVGSRIAAKAMGLGMTIVFALLIYALMMAMGRKTRSRMTSLATDKTLRTFGIGLGFVVGLPFVAVLALLTVILIPASLLSLMLWALALLCTTAVSAYIAMDVLSHHMRIDSEPKRLLAFVVAVLALELLMMVPFLGVIVRIATVFLSMGVLFSMLFLRPKKGAEMAEA